MHTIELAVKNLEKTNNDIFAHVRGESIFLDDTPTPKNLLHAVVFYSPYAHAKIKKLDIEEAAICDGVVGIFLAKDIPGENQIGIMIQDQPLLVETEIHYIGEPIAIVVAKKEELARKASKHIKLEVEHLPVIIDPREAYKLGNLLTPHRVLSVGNVDEAWKDCQFIAQGSVSSGGQEHCYLETQRAMVIPQGGGKLKILSSTQNPTGTQFIISKVLNVPMHSLEVNVQYIGGGFGGKQIQSIQWATLAALAAYKLKTPVKLVLNRKEDLEVTGKRHPFSSDFKIGIDKKGKICAYEVLFFQNGGAYADLSPAVMERALFDVACPYYIPNIRATGFSCITNLHPFTACRGFGSPQAAFVMENAIYAIADKMKISPYVIQEKNLIKNSNTLIYGRKLYNVQLTNCWNTLKQKYEIKEIINNVNNFNSSNEDKKKGIAILPICYGIGFFAGKMENDQHIYPLNQASALIHIYVDGSVSVNTGAVEMGQGINTKIRQIVAKILSISPSRIEINATNTGIIANSLPTAASTGTDLNGGAAASASKVLMQRLKQFIAKEIGEKGNSNIIIKNEQVYVNGEKISLKWEEVIKSAFLNRVNLSAQAHYATPGVYYNKQKEKGKPFSYYTYGAALIEATLDCLRCTYDIDSVRIVHDLGKSINVLIDKGQVEGGVVQGIGWMTTECLNYGNDGTLSNNTLSTYKIPTIKSAAKQINIHFLKNVKGSSGVFNSKTVGESPFLYGIGVYFAVLEAMKAFNPNQTFTMSSPITPEKIMTQLKL